MISADKASYKKSSFGPAFLFLDKRRREALAVYYAFCRLMDDIADEPGVPDREKELSFWREEILRVYASVPQTDLGKELCSVVRDFSMPQDRFLLLIEGMQADIQGRQYANQKELAWYLWRVAGIVGLATLDILGVKGPKAQELALTLGSAVQLTNIVRDVHEDALLGRVYLPLDLLAQYGLTREEVIYNARPELLVRVLSELARQSEAYYAQSQTLMAVLPSWKMLPCRIMACVYRANLAKIKKTDFLFTKQIKLSKTEKSVQGVYALLQTFVS